MTRRPVILLDVDGVLANFIEANLATLRELGVERQHDDVRAWSVEESLGLTSAQRAQMKARWSEAGFCASIPVYEGAAAGVELLRSIGEVYAVTAPMWSAPTWQHERTEWLMRHFDFTRDQVVSTAAKHLVRGDIFVEDKPETLARWAEAWPGALPVLWDRPYNAGVEHPVRTRSWGLLQAVAAEVARGLEVATVGGIGQP